MFINTKYLASRLEILDLDLFSKTRNFEQGPRRANIFSSVLCTITCSLSQAIRHIYGKCVKTGQF